MARAWGPPKGPGRNRSARLRTGLAESTPREAEVAGLPLAAEPGLPGGADSHVASGPRDRCIGIVGEVLPSSPGAAAGLRPGDRLLSLGSLSHDGLLSILTQSSHDRAERANRAADKAGRADVGLVLGEIARQIAAHEGVRLVMEVVDDEGAVRSLSALPTAWNGEGLLGIRVSSPYL